MEVYIGTILHWPLAYAPQGWAFCRGQLLPINNNQALFSLIGTTYGGDGKTTFGLPDLRGRTPIGATTTAPNNPNTYGATGGSEGVVLTAAQLALHTHSGVATPTNVIASADLPINNADGTVANPAVGTSVLGNGFTIDADNSGNTYPIKVYTNTAINTPLNAAAVSTTVTPSKLAIQLSSTGGVTGNPPTTASHENRQPFLGMNFIIATTGYYPPQP